MNVNARTSLMASPDPMPQCMVQRTIIQGESASSYAVPNAHDLLFLDNFVTAVGSAGATEGDAA